MRILLAPQEIAGYMGRLKSGFIELGAEARFYDLTSTYARYGGADRCGILSAYRRLEDRLRTMPRVARRMVLSPVEIIVRLYLFAMALVWADIIVFGFAATYLWGLDLPFYRALGKKVAFVYFGSDSRPCYLNGKFIHGENALNMLGIRRRAGRQKRRIRWFDRFSDIVIDHPPSALFHERPFIPFLRVGLPVPIPGGAAVREKTRGPTVVVHAPSSPLCKGTGRIRNIVRRAVEKGYRIEYVELTGQANSEVLRRLGECDFVFDEIYTDSLLAGLGTEAASLGKAALVAGYANPAQLGVTPAELPPAFSSRPDKVEATFLEMLDRPDEVRRLGERARAFVTERWSGRAVASRFLSALTGDGLRSVEPGELAYFRGWGVDESVLRPFLRKYIRRYGAGALYLDDKPGLKRAILEFAEGGRP